MSDTHASEYNAPHPDREEVATFIDELLKTSQLGEEVGFDGL